MKKKMMGLLLGIGALLISIGMIGCERIDGIVGQCFPNPFGGSRSCQNPPSNPNPSTDLADKPDLATPDLATPDLATPDLETPDLGTPSDLPPSDIAVQVGDMTGAGNPIDLALQKFDLGMCIGNGKNNVYGWPNPRCGADCGPNCDASEGCDPLNGNNDCRKKHPLYGDLICVQRAGLILDGGMILDYYCTPPPSP